MHGSGRRFVHSQSFAEATTISFGPDQNQRASTETRTRILGNKVQKAEGCSFQTSPGYGTETSDVVGK